MTNETTPKGQVILTGLDVNGRFVIEERMNVADYYELLHPLLDEDRSFRAERGIRCVEGRVYNYDGKVDQKFTNEYDEHGEYVSSRIVFADGTVSES